jgi:phosphatidylglycerophosphate synthase
LIGALRKIGRGDLRNVPTAFTSARLLLTIPICWAIVLDCRIFALVLFVLAATTDLLDGWIARAWRQTSGFGQVFDLSTDGILFLSVLVCLASTERLNLFWAVTMTLSGVIPVVSQGWLILRSRQLITFNDSLGKVCGGAAYLCLAAGVAGKGVDLLFSLSLPLIYMSVLRDLATIAGLRVRGRARLFNVGNDLLLAALAKLEVGPIGFISWLALTTAFVNVTLSTFHGTFWPLKGALCFLEDRRALFIDFVACPVFAFFWVQSPQMVHGLLRSLSAAKRARDPRSNIVWDKASGPWRKIWKYAVPLLLPVFEAAYYIPAQRHTARGQYFYGIPELFAAKAALWIFSHYMIAMFFVNTTPVAWHVWRQLPTDGDLDAANEDGVYGLSGIGHFIRNALIFTLCLSILWFVVFYRQCMEVKIYATYASGGLNFVALWAVPLFVLYGLLLYRAHRLMARFRAELLHLARLSLQTNVECFRRNKTPQLLYEVGRAALAHDWISRLPVFPLKYLRPLIVLALNASFLSGRLGAVWRLVYSILSRAR